MSWYLHFYVGLVIRKTLNHRVTTFKSLVQCVCFCPQQKSDRILHQQPPQGDRIILNANLRDQYFDDIFVCALMKNSAPIPTAFIHEMTPIIAHPGNRFTDKEAMVFTSCTHCS